MPVDRHITFFHAPHSRAGGVRILIEELQAAHDLHVLNLRKEDQRQPSYLAINPMGKVPAIRHGDTIITEQAAVHMYLAELYPERKLAPAIGAPLRGAYLRWMVFYGSCFEPALVDKAMKRDSGGLSMSPYGDYAHVVASVEQQLQHGPWWLGEHFTAADTLWGSALTWTTAFGLLPPSSALDAYLARFAARPAVQRATALDAALADRLATEAAHPGQATQ